MTITTFCLAGFTGRLLDRNHLGGELFRAPFTRRDINYNNKFFGNANFNDGRAKAKAALLASTGQVVLLGQSLGARIAGSLLDDPDVLEKCPPSRMVCVLTGHPDRKYGGASTVQYSGITEGYSYSGLPDDCQYRVWDIANEFDFAADHPTNRKNAAAVKNASDERHSNYRGTFIGDPRNTTWRDPENPNVIYVLAPSHPLPTIESRWWSRQKKYDEDVKQRPAVNAGYSRPFPAPKTSINRYFNTNRGYDGALRREVTLPAPAPFRPFG